MSKKYLKLKNYISGKMNMSHIYQPLMLIELIKGNVIPKTFLKNLETPEKSTSLAFFCEKIQRRFNEGKLLFQYKLKMLNYIKFK